MNLDVLILSYQNPATVLRALDSLRESLSRTSSAKVHVWVADNGSDPNFSQALRKSFPKDPSFFLVLFDQNLGFARGMQSLWSHVQPKSWVLFLNSDTTILPQFFSAMEATLSTLKSPRPWVLRLPIEEHGQVYRGGRLELFRLTGRMIAEPRGHFVSGCAMIVSAKDFDQAPWDPDFFFYGEDVEFSQRWQERGDVVSIEDEALKVRHEGRGSTPSFTALRFHFAGRRTLARKMFHRGERALAVGAICVVSVELMGKSLAWLVTARIAKLKAAWAGWVLGYPKSR